VLLLDDARHLLLAPAFDVLPAGQALGYQQMRVGRDGADSTIANAMSEAALFGLSAAEARAEAARVAQVCDKWKAHFAQAGVTRRDIAYLARFIDRDFLLDQRRELTGGKARRPSAAARRR
jgi:serine/threonine-protein kinase HipA